MIRNYWSAAFRHAVQHPLYAFINLFSLAIGLAACMVIFLFVKSEKSFDQFHQHLGQIYRIYGVPNYGTTADKVAITPGWMGPELPHYFPSIQRSTRYWDRGKAVFQTDQKQVIIEHPAAVDSTFLEIFDFKLIAGNTMMALARPQSVVLTETTARKLLMGIDAALGKVIAIDGTSFTVTGIVQDVPENSHLQFDALVSIASYAHGDRMFKTSWDGSFLNTYVLVNPHAEVSLIEKGFPGFIAKNTGVTDMTKTSSLYLQPLEDIHLGSTDIEHDYNNYRKFNGAYLNLFIVVGAFILLLAAVNFMNLTLARSSFRDKEVGIRRSIGAGRMQVIIQFMFESTIHAVGSVVVALTIVSLSLQSISNLLGRSLTFSQLITDPWAMGSLLLGAVVLGLLSGLYPAVVVSKVSSSNATNTQGRPWFNQLMIVGQFAVAIAMIEGALLVQTQVEFMSTADSGFEKDQIVLVGMNGEVNEKLQLLKSELTKNTLVTGVTASDQRMGTNLHGWGFKVKYDTGVYAFTPSNINVDYDYLDVYGIPLAEGRTFSRDIASDQGRAFIINERMVHELGLRKPIGTEVGHSWYENNELGSVIGVTKDFHYNSLHFPINAVAIVCHPDWGFQEMSIKIDGTRQQEALEFIESVWRRTITSYPFEYSFLSNHMNELYRSDRQMESLVSLATTLALIISSIGLFGLASIVMQKRVKEVGIRKILGATSFQLSKTLSGHFVLIILIAFTIASPIAYRMISSWLNEFAYRIDNGFGYYAAGGVVALMACSVTIGYHVWRLTRENPVKALRD